MSKKYDLVAVTGTYTTRDGKEKKRYENVGAVMEGQHGPYVILKKTFNPAGISSDGDSIFLSMFESKQRQQKAHQQTEEFDQDIPF